MAYNPPKTRIYCPYCGESFLDYYKPGCFGKQHTRAFWRCDNGKCKMRLQASINFRRSMEEDFVCIDSITAGTIYINIGNRNLAFIEEFDFHND